MAIDRRNLWFRALAKDCWGPSEDATAGTPSLEISMADRGSGPPDSKIVLPILPQIAFRIPVHYCNEYLALFQRRG